MKKYTLIYLFLFSSLCFAASGDNNNTQKTNKTKIASEVKINDEGDTTNVTYVINGNNTISSYEFDPNDFGSKKLNLKNVQKTEDFPSQIAAADFGPENRYIYVTNYFEGSISRYNVSPDGMLSKKQEELLMGKGVQPSDIKIFRDSSGLTKALIVNKLGKLIQYTVKSDGKLTDRKEASANSLPMSVEQFDNELFLVPNYSSQTISIFRSKENNLKKVKDIQLKDNGFPIEISKDLRRSNVFFLLTTNGIYAYWMNQSKYYLVLIDHYDQYFDINSHIKSINGTSIVVTTGPSNNVHTFVINKINGFKIIPQNDISTNYPSGLDIGIGYEGTKIMLFTSRDNNTISSIDRDDTSLLINGIGLDKPKAIKFVQWKNR